MFHFAKSRIGLQCKYNLLQEVDCSDLIINQIRIVNVSFEIISDVTTYLKAYAKYITFYEGAAASQALAFHLY
jgi:hypothetical protein